MAVTQQHISSETPMGGNPVDGGATFRVWAPRAGEVFICGDFNDWVKDDSSRLTNHDGRWAGLCRMPRKARSTNSTWSGRVPPDSSAIRMPAISPTSGRIPTASCARRRPSWQDWGWRTPDFRDLIVYQLHVGTWYGPGRENRVAKFLDVLDRVESLADLGFNAIEPLPIVEYSTPRSLGYNGSDLFSPEMDYEVNDGELDTYLPRVNRLLVQKGKSPLSRHVVSVGINQLKALVDICHHYGIAVGADPNDSLYFTREDHTGPVFAFWNQDVRQFLIDNARFFIEEYHVDGFRYDQVTVIDRQNAGSGWLFCQNLNGTLNAHDPSAINIAEYWGPEPAVVRPAVDGGAGFHANWHDGLRRAVRGVLEQAAGGAFVPLSWQGVVDQLRAGGFPDAWRAVQYVESHDEVYRDRGLRVPSLAVGGGNTRTWYATSRARVALGIIMCAPGIPMVFMGQEFYEDKRWADDPPNHRDTLIHWDGLSHDKTMIDFHRFTRELVWLRRRHPALKGEGTETISMEDGARVLVFQRWVEGIGRDVVVITSLNEATQYSYRIPLSAAGRWYEVFNSDIYENWVNPGAAGNGGSIYAEDVGLNGLAHSASITVPANSILVFARDHGD